MNVLDAQLLAAHAAEDAPALVRLYTQAAEEAHDIDASAFYLTHAYVFALEAGLGAAQGLRMRLVRMGRETPLQPSETISL
jgi:hypothetical protein